MRGLDRVEATPAVLCGGWVTGAPVGQPAERDHPVTPRPFPRIAYGNVHREQVRPCIADRGSPGAIADERLDEVGRLGRPRNVGIIAHGPPSGSSSRCRFRRPGGLVRDRLLLAIGLSHRVVRKLLDRLDEPSAPLLADVRPTPFDLRVFVSCPPIYRHGADL